MYIIYILLCGVYSYLHICCLGCSDLDKRSICFPLILHHQYQQVTSGIVSANNSHSWTKVNILEAVGETGACIQMGTGIWRGLDPEESTHCYFPFMSMSKLGRKMQDRRLEGSIL